MNEEMLKQLPKEAQKKLKEIFKKAEDFSNKATKSVKEVVGVSLLPPKEDDKEKINLLVVLKDADYKFEDKFPFKEESTKKLKEIAEKIDKNLNLEVLLLEELWQSCYDGKHDLLQLIAMSTIVYDKGMMASIKIAEVHKSMVVKKFEKYIVSYVLVGSQVQGRATEESDIDVFIVVDDTDVKKMTRIELREKLRGIILGMGYEAGMMTGIKNKINIQVYILTDFWDGLKEANPVYFTMLRDGIPFFDRGTFMPWKFLLKMGKIKPSQEAIDMHMSTGEHMIKRVQAKINEIGMEDLFWATLNPTQAALMSFGLPPPTPKETCEVLREFFVKREGILEEEYVKIMENIIKTRKDLEHKPDQKLSGKELDKLLTDANKYLKRINKLFEKIQEDKSKEEIVSFYENVMTMSRDALSLEGVEKVDADNVKAKYKNNLVTTGKMPEKTLRQLSNVLKAKKDHEAGKLTKSEVEKVKKEYAQFSRSMLEFIQHSRGKEIEKTKIRVKHGEKYAEVTMLEDKAFIVDDMDDPSSAILVADIKKDGSLGNVKDSSVEELEKALSTVKIPEKVFVKQPVFDNLKERYGKDSEILITF